MSSKLTLFLSAVILTLLVSCNLFDSTSGYDSNTRMIGDINSNGVAYEVADWVLLQKYLIGGESVLPDGTAIGLGDINRDGHPFTVTDLVCFRRIFDGDAKPTQRFPSEPVEVNYELGELLYVADPIGAVRLILEGTVYPEEITDQLEVHVGHRDNQTYVLINPLFGGTYNDMAGQLIYLEHARIIEIEMALADGAPVKPVNLLPETVVLLDNYPNPFSYNTTISFDLANRTYWEIEILDVEARSVDEFSGISDAGHVEIVWDPGDLPGGVYFYRLTIGSETFTKAMLYYPLD